MKNFPYLVFVSIFFLYLIILMNGCIKKDNIIPEVCFLREVATFSINDSAQLIKDDPFQGVNLNYLFGIKPTGEWSVALQSQQYLLSIFVSECFSFKDYQSYDAATWERNLPTCRINNPNNNERIEQFMLHDLEVNDIFEKQHILSGNINYAIEQIDNDCLYIRVTYAFDLRKNNRIKNLDGTILAAVPFK
jgi:hypothetical protein